MAAIPDADVMMVRSDVDPKRLESITSMLIDSVDDWARANGGTATAQEAVEGYLCAACKVMQHAPDNSYKAMLADHAIELIMANCGVEPSVVLAYRLWKRTGGLHGLKPEGSA